MKNILVDAIREAHGGTNDESSELSEGPADVAHSTAQHQLEQPAAHDAIEELALLVSTGVFDTADGVLDGDGGKRSLALTSSDATRGETVAYERESQKYNVSAEIGVTATIDIAGSSRIARYDRLAWASPIIGILLMVAASGSYMLYQKVSGAYLNQDLAGLGSQNQQGTALQLNDEAFAVSSPFQFEEQKHIQGIQRTTASEAAIASSVDTRSSVETPERNADGSTAILDVAYLAVSAAFDAFNRGDLGKAESNYRTALEISPSHPRALEGYAAVMQRTNRLEHSLVLYEELLSLEPSNAVAAAAVLAGNRRLSPGKAELELKFLVHKYPASPQLQFAIATHYANSEKWPEARVGYERALSLDADNADYAYNLAISFENLGKFDSAKKTYKLAMQLLAPESAVSEQAVSRSLARLSEDTQQMGQLR